MTPEEEQEQQAKEAVAATRAQAELTEEQVWQLMIRQRYLVPLYKQTALGGLTLIFSETSPAMVQLMHVQYIDAMVLGPTGIQCVKEVIVRPRPGQDMPFYDLEMVAPDGSEGWFQKSIADYILFAFPLPADQGVAAHLISFHELRAWASQGGILKCEPVTFEMRPVARYRRATPALLMQAGITVQEQAALPVQPASPLQVARGSGAGLSPEERRALRDLKRKSN